MNSKAAKQSRSAKSTKKTATQRRPIEAEDLLRLRHVSDPQISPDGEQIVFTVRTAGDKPSETASNLWIVETAGGEPRPFTAGGKDQSPRWSPDGSQLAFISGRDDQPAQIYLISARGGEAVPLTRFPEGSIREFRWSPDGRSLAVTFRETDADRTKAAQKEREAKGASAPPWVIEELFYRYDGEGYFGHQRHALFIVDAASGDARLVFDKDSTGHFSFDWSPDSRQLVAAVNTSRHALQKPWKAELLLIDAESGKSRKVPNLPAGTKSFVRWSPDGRWLAFTGREGKQPIWDVANQQLHVCTPDGNELRNLSAESDYCLECATLSDTRDGAFEPLFWSRDSQRIFLNLGWQGEHHVASVAVEGGPIAFHTTGERTVTLTSLNTDGTRLAFTEGNAVSPVEVAVGSWESATPGPVGEASLPDDSSSVPAPGDPADICQSMPVLRVDRCSDLNGELLREIYLSTPEMQWIESTGGARVQMWVMKPIGYTDGKKYPAVLEIHGGPHTQYGFTFFHEFQLLAANGYVVVFSNPRGSKGYGESHCMAIRGNWGSADWDDIQAVTAAMRRLPFVSSRRMGVMGGSYGGYMTNWAITHCDDFAAAITDRCVSNIVSLAGTSDVPLVSGHYWKGSAWDDVSDLWEQSPLKYFGRVNIPTLILHSEGDLRCNIEQAEQIYTALKLRDVPTRFVRYPASSSHGMSRSGPPDLRLHRLQEILRWWKRHLE